MKNLSIFTVAACVAALALTSCFSRPKTVAEIKKVRLEQLVAENFTHPSLKRFISDPENSGASVVVRVPNDPAAAQIGSLIERALMIQGYNTRDRIMFENAVAKLEDGSDYAKIREKTGTDLIFEVTQFSTKDVYPLQAYEDQLGGYHAFQVMKTTPVPGKKKKVTTTFIPVIYYLWGYSVEVKVILLSDNLIAGTYKYYMTPCTSGGLVSLATESHLTYQSLSGSGLESASADRQNPGVDSSSPDLAEFISDTVIPNMFAEMKK